MLDTGHCEFYTVDFSILFYSFKECWDSFSPMVKLFVGQPDPFQVCFKIFAIRVDLVSTFTLELVEPHY